MPTLAGRRLAVVGGSGFIGSHLVERLVGEGADVVAVTRSAERLSHLSAVRGSCVIALADICDFESVRRVFRRVQPQIVYHLASHPDADESFTQIVEGLRVNGLGLVNTLNAAAAAGAELFVYGDSAKDYGNGPVPYRAMHRTDPVCSYAVVKSAGWQLCRLVSSFTALQTVALRPTFVYGPRQNRNVISYVHDCVTNRRPVRLMGGTQTRDPLYIDDAVSAFVAAATERAAWGHAIPIGGGQELTVTSLCEAVIATLGASVPVVAGAEQPRLTEIWRSSSDNVDAARLLHWEPRVTLSEGLVRTVSNWVRGGIAAATELPVPVTPRPGCFLHASTAGVTFRLLNRRSGDERRIPARGGRRASDALAPTMHAASVLTGASGEVL
jgi:nucleoside-diphosphate-sugar epimerase